MEKLMGKLVVNEVIENEDGTATINFDLDDEFKNDYIKIFKLEEWSDSHFNDMMVKAIEDAVKTESYEKNIQDPDFLWDMNKNV